MVSSELAHGWDESDREPLPYPQNEVVVLSDVMYTSTHSFFGLSQNLLFAVQKRSGNEAVASAIFWPITCTRKDSLREQFCSRRGVFLKPLE